MRLFRLCLRVALAATALVLMPGGPARDAQAEAPVASCTFAQHGAKGDGIADDTAAVQKAVASGCGPVVDGQGLVYRVTRTVSVKGARGLTIANARFLDQVPVAAWERRVVSVVGSTGVTLRNLKIDRGSDRMLTDGTNGPPNHLMSLRVEDSRSVTIEDVEIWGDGAGTAIYVLRSADVRIVRAHVHDMHAEAPSPHENLVGIWSILSENVEIVDPTIARLFGAKHRLPVESDAISVSGSRNLTVTGAKISFVNEGVDIGGSTATEGFTIRDSIVSDASNVCFKFGHAARGLVEGSRGSRCALAGFFVFGDRSREITFRRDVAVDPGSNGWFVQQKSAMAPIIAGFHIARGEGDPSFPRDIVIEDSQSIDDQPAPTMQRGFANTVEVPGSGNVARRVGSRGHVRAGIVGFEPAPR